MMPQSSLFFSIVSEMKVMIVKFITKLFSFEEKQLLMKITQEFPNGVNNWPEQFELV